MLWALTSGAAGTFYGSDDWEFHDGWETRLDTAAVAQLDRLRRLFDRAGLVAPGSRHRRAPLVTAGRGTELTDDTEMDVLDNDYVTAARTPDGTLAVVYVPSCSHHHGRPDHRWRQRSTAAWVDPVSGDAAGCPDGRTLHYAWTQRRGRRGLAAVVHGSLKHWL